MRACVGVYALDPSTAPGLLSSKQNTHFRKYNRTEMRLRYIKHQLYLPAQRDRDQRFSYIIHQLYLPAQRDRDQSFSYIKYQLYLPAQRDRDQRFSYIKHQLYLPAQRDRDQRFSYIKHQLVVLTCPTRPRATLPISPEIASTTTSFTPS